MEEHGREAIVSLDLEHRRKEQIKEVYLANRYVEIIDYLNGGQFGTSVDSITPSKLGVRFTLKNGCSFIINDETASSDDVVQCISRLMPYIQEQVLFIKQLLKKHGFFQRYNWITIDKLKCSETIENLQFNVCISAVMMVIRQDRIGFPKNIIGHFGYVSNLTKDHRIVMDDHYGWLELEKLDEFFNEDVGIRVKGRIGFDLPGAPIPSTPLTRSATRDV